MGRVIDGVNGQVDKVQDAAALELECRQNFNARSDCMAGIVFDGVDIEGHVLVGLFLARCGTRSCLVELYNERGFRAGERERG